MQYILVFITTPNRKEAKKISKVLLNRRIIACANIIGNIDSNFWWQGKKQHATECLLIAKTTKGLFKKLAETVKAMHSYEVPEIIAVPIVAGSKAYLEWIRKEVT